MRGTTFILAGLLLATLLAVATCANSSGGDDDSTTDDDSTDDTGDDGGDDTGGPPSYPSNHDATWNCYICHETDFQCATGEPHGGAYNPPDDCVGCHQKGTWTNAACRSTMNAGQNCLNCHDGQHGKSWESADQCAVCHH
jgi:hypothetical protein